MYELTIRIMASIKMRTVTKTLVRILINNRSKMLLFAKRMPPGFLALISGTVVTVLEVLLLLEL
jgi:hypothetical protein